MVLEAIRLLRRELQGKVPLIGFAGAPFTLASYAIEGGHSSELRPHEGASCTPIPRPGTGSRRSSPRSSGDYLRAQVEAGVEALQVFDSWIGALDAADYREFVLPHVRASSTAWTPAFHVIHFGTGTGHLLAAQREAGGDVIGLDWRTPLDEGWRAVGDGVAVQGNLDPTLLLGPRDRLLSRVDDVLRSAGGRPGHIFNLGHGILPATPVENVRAVVTVSTPTVVDVAIVGGGIGGLTAARVLNERGVPFVLLEASDSFGGVIRSERESGFSWEAGPDAILAQKPEGIALCRELGLGERLVPTNPVTKAVYVLRRGRLHPLPDGMMLAVPTRVMPFLTSGLFSWPGKVRMGLDLVIPRRRDNGDESIASFLRRRFGQESVDLLGEPLLAGIHSGDPERLSMKATFPRFVEMERRSGSLIRALMFVGRPPHGSPGSAFYSLDGGLTSLIEALVGRLPVASLRPSSPVTSVGRAGETFRIEIAGHDPVDARAVILASPPPRAAPLLGALDAVLSESLSAISCASTSTVVLGYRRSDIDHPLDGYGLLVPRLEGLRTTALSFVSTKFPAGRPKATCFSGPSSAGRGTPTCSIAAMRS